jgi:hypothetical protein
MEQSNKKREQEILSSIDKLSSLGKDYDNKRNISSIDFSKMTKENIIDYLDELADKTDFKHKEFQEFLSYKNKIEEEELELFSDEYKDLYPNLLDPLFNIKIFQKREYNNLIYNKEIQDVIKESDKLCNSGFELSLHQKFVRNYLSRLTPYNNLLLYHGLGTGKTCSAISICEEMRKYMKEINSTKKIIVVASPNVQDNFKLQLFDDRKLKKINNEWILSGCTGNSLIKEINPTNMEGLTKKQIIKLVNKNIRQYYSFMGYEQFSNYITKIKDGIKKTSNEEVNYKRISKHIKRIFSDRLIVIDEVQNIRSGGYSINKKLENNFLDIVRLSKNLKLLFLSATPMFNSYKEIIWLINLMNLNDKRPQIKTNDIFDKYGNFKEEGKEIFIRKTRGYISFVRGENPYSFPYRIYPSLFNKSSSIYHENFSYPTTQVNNISIKKPMEMIDIYLSNIDSYQRKIYELSLDKIKESIDDIKEDEERGLGWQKVDKPLQTLNIVYPNTIVDKHIQNNDYDKINVDEVIGSNGLKNIMNFNSKKQDFEYKKDVLDNYGRFFQKDILKKYSHKISSIIENIQNSKGVVLIYSQYIDGGCIPLALALEEIGITRYGASSSLFKTKPVSNVDYETFKNKEETLKIKDTFKPAKYIMITGDNKISIKNALEVKAASSDNNINGEEVKVVIISQAGSEGIDFKFIRQVHILEPWYNMSRIEQIIGRGVRFCSHKLLPFVERNVEIYLYATRNYNEYEPLDMYIYRIAENKAIQIGKVSRVLKENAVDCLLNIKYNNLTVENMDQNIRINLSSGKNINYDIGDKPYTNVCDYMDKCDFKCKPYDYDVSNIDILDTTYDEDYVVFNIDVIINRIKDLFREKYVYKREQIIYHLKQLNNYTQIQIDYALSILINDKTEYLIDILGRKGNLVNIGDYYLFQPLELSNTKISLEERKKPIETKINKINIELPEQINTNILTTEKDVDVDVDVAEYTDSIIDKKIIIPSTKKIRISSIEKTINDNYDYYITATTKLEEKSKDWYGNILNIKNNIFNNEYYNRNIQKISDELFDKYIIEMIVDRFEYNKFKNIVEYLYNKFSNTEDTQNVKEIFMKKMYKYIEDAYMLKSSSVSGILLSNNKLVELYIFKKKDDNYILKYIPSNNIVELEKQLENIGLLDSYKTKVYNKNQINNIVGFSSYIDKINKVIIKVKNIKLKRNTGARLDQASKTKMYDLLHEDFNEIIDIEKIKTTKKSDKEFIPSLIQLSIILEILLRHYQNINKNNKIWYMPEPISNINNIEKLYIE